MPQFVSEGVERLCQSPTEGSAVDLVVRVDATALSRISEWVAEHGGSVTDSMDHGLLELTLPEVHAADLCELDSVSSVERADETIEVLGSGN